MSGYDAVPGLEVALTDGVLELRIARPEKRNALDDTMMYALIDAVDAAGRDEAVRVILLTSVGDHFCSGFDIVSRNDPGGAAAAGGQHPTPAARRRRTG